MPWLAPTSSVSPEKGTEDATGTEHPPHPQGEDKCFPMILEKAQLEWARSKTSGNV